MAESIATESLMEKLSCKCNHCDREFINSTYLNELGLCDHCVKNGTLECKICHEELMVGVDFTDVCNPICKKCEKEDYVMFKEQQEGEMEDDPEKAKEYWGEN